MKSLMVVVFVVGVLCASLAWAEKAGHGPEAVEWGKVEWRRDLEEGIAAAKDSGKPLFLLFQEVPG